MKYIILSFFLVFVIVSAININIVPKSVQNSNNNAALVEDEEEVDCIYNWEEHPYAKPMQPNVAMVKTQKSGGSKQKSGNANRNQQKKRKQGRWKNCGGYDNNNKGSKSKKSKSKQQQPQQQGGAAGGAGAKPTAQINIYAANPQAAIAAAQKAAAGGK